MFNISLTKKKAEKTKYSINAAVARKRLLSWPNAWLLWFCQCVNIALISLELSPWMLAIITLCLFWQAFLFKKHVANDKQVSSSLLAIIAVAACIAIVISAKSLGVLASMVHLLCISYVLKAFELKKRRDFYQLWLLGLFVLAAALIFRQNLAFAMVSFLAIIVNLSVLLLYFSVNSTTGLDDRQANKVSGKFAGKPVIDVSFKKSLKESLHVIKTVTILVLQSMVLAVVLFVVFPRLAPFWKVPLANSATTGLSDTLQPGDIANLARSTELAFRADFNDGDIPAYSKLYWRVMTLENYNGRQWTRAAKFRQHNAYEVKQPLPDNNLIDKSVPVTSYQVIAEPSFQRYLFALGPATSADPKLTSISDYTWQANEPVNQSINYSMNSYLTASLEQDLSITSARLNLAYPKNSNPKLEALAAQLQRDYVNVEHRAQAILEMISQQNFFYTLQPPLLINNSLDQFFFSTQAGFCSHYASAFTFLMRASGVPARIVTGYLGGEYNDKSANEETAQGHLSIYQYDAHAWSEIWVKEKGWLRIDPTGAVDPQRVNSGWSSELLQQQSILNNDFLSLYRFKQFEWLNSLRLQFDALDYQWARLVLGYSTKQQVDLLKELFGKMVPWKLALIITLSLVLSFAILMLIFKWRDRDKTTAKTLTPWLVLYLKALKLLAKQGIIKESTLTVNAFAKQVRQKHPSIAIHFTRFSNTFNLLSYQQLTKDEQEKLTSKIQSQYRSFAQATKRLKS